MSKVILSLMILLHCVINVCGQRGKDGAKTIAASNIIVNEFTNLTSNANAGATSVTVANSGLNSNSRFPLALSPGDLIMVIQMQGATIDGTPTDNNWGRITAYNNCGVYEFAEVLSVPNATTIVISCPLKNSYTSSGKVQVIRVPRYSSLTINSGGILTTSNWNGTIGGVLVVEVLNNTTINAGGLIDATGRGFRGGMVDNEAANDISLFFSTDPDHGAEKGESIAGFQADYNVYGGRYCRGAAANGGGGGNAHNAGGGGGANAGIIANWTGDGNPDISNVSWITAWNLESAGFSSSTSSGGGRGGYTYSSVNRDALTLPPGNATWGGDKRRNVAGKGGRPLDYSTGRLFLGGGGGAGDGNNLANNGGGSGGGLVYVLSFGTIGGSGQVIADGNPGPNTIGGGNDAPGGGGGGGTIILSSIGMISGISARANGAKGGNQIIASNEAEGPGGGGGGGYIATSNGSIVQQVLGGVNGTTNSASVTEFIPNGSTKGGSGISDQIVTAPFVLQAINDTVCAGSAATLTASITGSFPAGTQILWYTVPVGGTSIATGNTYTTPVLTISTTYYVGTCPGTYRIPVYAIVTPSPTVTITPTHVTCKIKNDGKAIATPTGGTPPYTYLWNTSPAQTNSSASSLKAGSYTVTVTDSRGCTGTSNVTITEPAFLIATIVSTTSAGCNGGSITASASGGTLPYTYSWSPSGGTGATATGLPPGTYQVIVTDGNDCQALANGTIGSLQPLSAAVSSKANVLCKGALTGSAKISASGGKPGYTYSWSPSGGTDSVATGLGVGNYMVTVKDANNCSTVVNLTITEPPAITLSTTTVNTTCGLANGKATAITSGGTGTFTYVWSPGGASTSTATGLSAGTYTVIVTDANACSMSAGAIVNSTPPLSSSITSSTNVSCNKGKNGSATVTPTGGTTPYSYLWSPGNNTAAVNTGLAAGTYTVTVTDYNSCTSTSTVTLTEPPGMVLSTTKKDATCGGTNGEVSVSVTGGTPAYSYSWSHGPTTQTADVLFGGIYVVWVTDAAGCTDSAVTYVSNILGPTISISAISPVSCNKGSDGSATVVVSGGTAPFNYSWWPSGETTITASNLKAGTNAITVKDGNGCITIETCIITEPTILEAITFKTDVSCNGGSNGTASVFASGGTPGYTYKWSPGGGTSSTLTGLSSGTYSVTITDNNGCTATSSAVVTQPPILIPAIANTTNVSCNGGNDGSISITVSGGTAPYLYAWTPKGGNGPTASGLTAGTYMVAVTDDKGCKTMANSTVVEPPLLNISISSTNVVCKGGNTGSAIVNVTGGTSPYVYSWSHNGGTTAAANGLTAGNYFIKVTDGNQCQVTGTASISEPSLLTVSTSTVNTYCGQAKGKATAVASGGVSPYSYSWSTGQTDATADNLLSETYTVTITDANNCSTSTTATVSDIPAGIASVSVTPVSCNGGNNGTAKVSMSGGSAPFIYKWSSDVAVGPSAINLLAGTYTVTVTDLNGCTADVVAAITEPAALSSKIDFTKGITCFKDSDGSATVTASGGSAPYFYQWSTTPQQTTATAINLSSYSYSVTVTDINGCTSEALVSIPDPGEVLGTATASVHAICHGDSTGVATVNVTGGTLPYAYSWNTSPVQTGSMATGLKAGLYTVKITDFKGCTGTATVSILQPDPVILTTQGDTAICAGKSVTISALAKGGSSIYKYVWNHGLDTTGTHLVLPPSDTTYYIVTAYDNQGCPGNTDTIVVYRKTFTKANILLEGTSNIICNGSKGTVSVKSIGLVKDTVRFTWSNGLGTGQGPFTVYPTVTTTYTVTAVSSCGIEIVDTITVRVSPFPIVKFNASDTAGCFPLLVHFNDSSITMHSDSAIAWLWDFGDGYTSGLKNPSHTYALPGQYKVTLTVQTVQGCKHTLVAGKTIIVNSIPKAGFSYTPPVPTEYDGTIYFHDESSAAVKWLWDFGDKTDTVHNQSQIQNPIHTYRDTGTYCIKLLITNEHGCTNETTTCIKVRPDWSFYVPNAFTPNGDGKNDFFKPSYTNVKEFKMYLFDRWGNMMFDTEDINKGWDGKANDGKEVAQIDVYVYKILVKDIFDRKHWFIGHVSLIK